MLAGPWTDKCRYRHVPLRRRSIQYADDTQASPVELDMVGLFLLGKLADVLASVWIRPKDHLLFPLPPQNLEKVSTRFDANRRGFIALNTAAGLYLYFSARYNISNYEVLVIKVKTRKQRGKRDFA